MSSRITRSSTDRMLGGVCGGIARYMNVDPTLVRIGFVLLALSGVSPFLYLILWLVVPSDTMADTSNWSQQVQQSIGEIQERATTVAKEVSTQVQKVTGNNQPPTQPPTLGGDQGPTTGPTQRL